MGVGTKENDAEIDSIDTFVRYTTVKMNIVILVFSLWDELCTQVNTFSKTPNCDETAGSGSLKGR
jgi:hypothetical protein